MAVRLILIALQLWLVFVNFVSNFVNASLTVRPTDTEVLVNHSTYFNCSTSTQNTSEGFVLWYHYPMNSPTRNDVYDEGQIMVEYKDRFSIETNLAEGVFNLVVVRPILADAGRYECQDGVGQGDKASAELIILEGNPICESNMHSDGVVGPNSCGLKPDEFLLTCRVTSFHGNTPPTLRWKKSDNEGSSSLRVCERSSSCNLTQRGDQIRNNQSFVCQTAKSSEQYGCSVGPVKVKYALSWSKEITESKGDVICSSNTSQPCIYKWYNAKSEENVSIDENLHTTVPGEYKCEAQCEMNRMNESCRFIAMQVYIVSPAPVSNALLALVSIPIICVFVVLIIIGVCLYKQNHPQPNPKAPPKDIEVPLIETEPPAPPKDIEVSLIKTEPPDSDEVDNPSEPSADLSSLPIITDQDMVESLTVNQYFIDKGTSGAIYGPFRWENKKCALKQILFSQDEFTKESEKNIPEKADQCKKLDHPNLVKVFDVWFPSPALYILMEYAEGKSLDKILRPKDASFPSEPFPLKIVKDWAFQIADGMKYLHYNDLVHRNLKAAHVLVMESSPDGLPNTLKIGSYTPIKHHDHATLMSVKGTMAWMAPEFIQDKPISKFCDVWSYGITVWEILTRDVPYKEIKKETDLVRKAINKTLKLEIPDSCPEPLKDLLTKCWNYEADKRPGFTEICDTLRARIWQNQVVTDSSPVQHQL